jgi:hypothetical protein
MALKRLPRERRATARHGAADLTRSVRKRVVTPLSPLPAPPCAISAGTRSRAIRSIGGPASSLPDKIASASQF